MTGQFEVSSRFGPSCFRNPPSYLQVAKIIPDSQCTLKTCTKCVVFAFSFLWLIWLFLRLLIIYKTMEMFFRIIHSSDLIWNELIFFSSFTYCWCWCDCVDFTWRCWSSWLWARRKARLTHWFLTHFTNFQLQTLLIWKYIAMLHLIKRRQISNHKFKFPNNLSFRFFYTWNSVVSFELGNMPELLNSSITSWRRCSNVFRWPFSAATSCDVRDVGFVLHALPTDCIGVLGVCGERSASFVFRSEWNKTTIIINTSMFVLPMNKK